MTAGRSKHAINMRSKKRSNEKKVTKDANIRNLIIDKKNLYGLTETEIGKELNIPRTTIVSICKKFKTLEKLMLID